MGTNYLLPPTTCLPQGGLVWGPRWCPTQLWVWETESSAALDGCDEGASDVFGDPTREIQLEVHGQRAGKAKGEQAEREDLVWSWIGKMPAQTVIHSCFLGSVKFSPEACRLIFVADISPSSTHGESALPLLWNQILPMREKPLGLRACVRAPT